MNTMTIYNNPDFGEIRTTIIDGEPWFVGKDVARILGYKDTTNALKSHVDSEDKRGWRITTPSGEQTMTVINESGLYSLILSSKLPKAKKFKRWVTSEVLPAIRKKGSYMTQEAERLLLETQMQIIERLEKLERNAGPTASRTAHASMYIENEMERENRNNLVELTKELSVLVAIPMNTLFHQLYVALEKKEGISISAYNSVYRSETGNPNASPLYMIASSEKLYQSAKELLEETIRRNCVF